MLTPKQIKCLNWIKTNNAIPVIIQHYISGEVLMHGYMNQDALRQTIQDGNVTFFSRTRKCLWTKGKTSGNLLKVVDMTSDCDNDTILILANPIGFTCHLENISCFAGIEPNLIFLYKLEKILFNRKKTNSRNSYTNNLCQSGIKRIAQKVGEEGIEVALAAAINNKLELINEASDLMYHLLVLLLNQNLDINMVISNLKTRNKQSH
ncbi:MAG: bifunctional phosphoribosyl-AMP cyclohydrolase/phosphoribosyl-ATP diphosphatase HisIE [Pantoea sp. Brub]|nr:bifunctional phosphoribosyl-AMP cyclohydrolase/phosphoribosyl-ATP diphosphatase HisIE [Pantoea sp. Brub]